MAITVESPGIASAKEEAAAILFGREQPTPPVMSTATVSQPAQAAAPQKPHFAAYRDPEPAPVYRSASDTPVLRPYQVFEEVAVTDEPKVVRPYIDSSDYLASAVAATSVTTPAPAPTVVAEPVATTTQTPQTVTVVQSALDTELEEDTQYIVKFKNSTIVAATILATIFLLLSVLFVVNIVNLVTVSAEVSTLTQETVALEESLAQGQANLEQARQEAAANGANANRNPQYVVKADSGYTAPSSTTISKSFFDWLCHALSGLFS